LLQYRIARKGALKLVMDKIARQLGHHVGGGHTGLEAADDWAGENEEL
jgi:hypothetical protein